MSFLRKNVVNLSINCELHIFSRDLNPDFSLDNWLLEAVQLTKNSDLINMAIEALVLDMIHVQNFHGQTVTRVKKLLFLELVIVKLLFLELVIVLVDNDDILVLSKNDK